MRVAQAVLIGGPLDGHREAIVAPAPDALTIAPCPDCDRRHAHPVAPGARSATPVYVLDHQASSRATARYRWEGLTMGAPRAPIDRRVLTPA